MSLLIQTGDDSFVAITEDEHFRNVMVFYKAADLHHIHTSITNLNSGTVIYNSHLDLYNEHIAFEHINRAHPNPTIISLG